jgi:DNA-binding SARP family transcriptional activator
MLAVTQEVGLDFRILGPLEIWHAGAQVEIVAPKQRDLLALLLTKPGDTADRDWLIEALWDGSPPPAAKTTLQSCVYRLRKVFEPHPEIALLTRNNGYLLELPPTAVDAHRFEQLVDLGLNTLSTSRTAAVRHLRAAMALWRGDAFADVALHTVREFARRLDERRLDVAEQRIAVELDLGHTTDVLGELKAIVDAHPLREGPSELLMTAQYRAGRRADALETYQRLYRRLNQELDVRPSQSASDLHRRILADASDLDQRSSLPHVEPQLTTRQIEPPTTMPVLKLYNRKPAAGTSGFDAPLPRQLPAGIGDFVGRADSLASLDGLLDAESDAMALAAVSGPPGVGKTTLAVHWAWQVMDRFPDGQLYVNLRGFDPSGQVMEPSEAVRGFLAALRVPPERIPSDFDAQVGLYRSVLAGKRMLILLDNARDVAQVRAFLPGSGSGGCLTLVTSRSDLTGLIATQGARAIVLEPFGVDDAHQLLERRLGSERVAAEPAAVEDMLAHCAGLPLAVAIVAARATAHSDFPLESVAADLRMSRGLDAFASTDVTADVRAVFSWSYSQLTPAAARLFRLLGLHPGPDIGRSAAASLASVPVRQARQLLAELCDARLVTETTANRYGLHDLLRVYAAELAEADETEAERDEAIRRLVGHYLQVAEAAARLSAPYGWEPSTHAPRPSVDTGRFIDEQFADVEGAVEWFDSERSVLMRIVVAAVRRGLVREAFRIAWHVGKFFDRRGHWHDYVELEAMLLEVAERLGDRELLTYAYAAYGRAVVRLDRNADARAYLGRAYELCGQVGDVLGQARMRRTVGWIAEREANYPAAFAATKEAYDLCRTVTDSVVHEAGAAELLSALGWCHTLLGDFASALVCCRLAVPVLQEHGYLDGEAHVWDTMGYAHHELGQFVEALDCFQRALPIMRRLGDAFAQADTLIRIAASHAATGALAEAAVARNEALSIIDTLHFSDADRLRAKLRTGTPAEPSHPAHPGPQQRPSPGAPTA